MTQAEFIQYASEQADVCLRWAVYHDQRGEADASACALRSAALCELMRETALRKTNFTKWYKREFGTVRVTIYAFPDAPIGTSTDNQFSLDRPNILHFRPIHGRINE